MPFSKSFLIKFKDLEHLFPPKTVQCNFVQFKPIKIYEIVRKKFASVRSTLGEGQPFEHLLKLQAIQ